MLIYVPNNNNDWLLYLPSANQGPQPQRDNTGLSRLTPCRACTSLKSCSVAHDHSEVIPCLRSWSSYHHGLPAKRKGHMKQFPRGMLPTGVKERHWCIRSGWWQRKTATETETICLTNQFCCFCVTVSIRVNLNVAAPLNSLFMVLTHAFCKGC